MHHKFINKIFDKVPGQSLKEKQAEIAALTGLSTTSVYNKMTNRSQFSFDDICLLSRTYSIDLNSLIDDVEVDNETAIFSIDGYLDNKELNDFDAYFLRIVDYAQFVKQGIFKKATFINGQTHMFNTLQYPSLVYLKFYVYNLMNWKDQFKSVYNSKIISSSQLFQEHKAETIEVYRNIDKEIILSINYLASTRSQISYLVDNKIIPQHELRILVDEIAIMIADLKQEISNGENQEIYLNHFINVSNMVIVEGDHSFFTIQMDVPHVIRTMDQRLINHMLSWVTSIKEYSTMISMSGGMARNSFFTHLDKELKKIANLL